MRVLSKVLLLVSVMTGLTLPMGASLWHDAGCLPIGGCCEEVVPDCDPCHPCDHDVPASPDSSHGEHDDDHPAPHEHQHHHKCACGGPGLSLIVEAGLISIAAPVGVRLAHPPEHNAPPDSPVFLLDRPPMA